MMGVMLNEREPIPDPSDAEVRLATEKALLGPLERLSPEDGVRLMQERITKLTQNIVGWNRILEKDPINDTARKCLATDQADLREAEARLKQYQLQLRSKN